jgi:hypothetical protein
MASNRPISKLEDIAFDALVKQGLFSVEAPTSVDPQKVSSVIEQKIHARLMPIFLQAEIDDHRKKVAELLDKNPELLLVKAQKGIEIQSQYTWVTLDVENEDALSIAAKRKQIKMIELLLPYYDKLEQTEELIKARAESLSAWKNYQIQKNEENGEDEIVIPREYADYAKSLIDVFREETFPKGIPGKVDEVSYETTPFDVALTEKTEDALKLLFAILLPKNAVKLDDSIDPELFLLALYNAYRDNFDLFQNWEQRGAFCVRMIGLAQSVLPPETAKIFCEGLYDVVVKKRKISERAESLKLLDGESFYRSSRESRSGPGMEYLCGALRCAWGRAARVRLWGRPPACTRFGKAMLNKSNKFSEHYAAIAATAAPTPCRS